MEYTAEEYEKWNEIERKFVDEVEKAGYTVNSYSGRFMYGRTCPSVNLDGMGELQKLCATTGVIGLKTDSLGLGIVAYTG